MFSYYVKPIGLCASGSGEPCREPNSMGNGVEVYHSQSSENHGTQPHPLLSPVITIQGANNSAVWLCLQTDGRTKGLFIIHVPICTSDT